jgi:FKBP-type peptidyl-prolyl cis-trans isomerase 2
MELAKGDFIELDFTGKIVDSEEIFDTTNKEVAKKASLDTKNLSSFKLSVGNEMLPKGFDSDLIGKDIGKEYIINLTPENAFGKRDPKLVRMIPTKHFTEQNIEPARGMQLDLDGQLTRILSSSGGRTLVDFNNPLAGKKIEYTYTILKKIEEQREKIDALQKFFFRNIFPFEISEKKVTFKVPEKLKGFIGMFEQKFKDILDIEIEAKVEEKSEDKKEKEKD